MQKIMAFDGGGHPKKIREKRGSHVKYFGNNLKWHNVLALKKCYRTKVEVGIQIYFKLSLSFKIALDIVFSPLSLSFI